MGDRWMGAQGRIPLRMQCGKASVKRTLQQWWNQCSNRGIMNQSSSWPGILPQSKSNCDSERSFISKLSRCLRVHAQTLFVLHTWGYTILWVEATATNAQNLTRPENCSGRSQQAENTLLTNREMRGLKNSDVIKIWLRFDIGVPRGSAPPNTWIKRNWGRTGWLDTISHRKQKNGQDFLVQPILQSIDLALKDHSHYWKNIKKTWLSFNFKGCKLGIVPTFSFCGCKVGNNYALAFTQPSPCCSSLPYE